MSGVSVATAVGGLRELIKDKARLPLRELVDAAAATDDLAHTAFELRLCQLEPFPHREQELHLFVGSYLLFAGRTRDH